MITSKSTKKARTFRNDGFQRENSLKISDEKKNKNKLLDLSKKPQWNTRPLNTITEDSTCNREEINRRKNEEKRQQ